MKETKRVTMRDIARNMNVSAVTVSKALTGKDGVGESLRSAIIRRAKDMGYRYSAAKNYNICILIADRYFSDNAFYSNMYKTVLIKAGLEGYSGILEVVSDFDEANCVMPQSVKSGKTDGVVFIGEMSREYICQVVSSGLPYVFLDFYDELYPATSVLSDNLFGAYALTETLIETGHRRIAFVGSVTATSSIFDRYLGYHKALLRHGLFYRDDWIIPDRDEDGRILCRIPMPSEMPDAFVCNCDETACVVVRTLNALGFSVPDDYSVVGYDDYIFATMCSPPLTTFRVNIQEMGMAATELLLSKIKRRHFSEGRTIISGNLVMRNSIKAR